MATTRRTLLKLSLGAGAVCVFGGIVPGMRQLAAATVRVRRNVNNLAPNDPDLACYRDFVGIMKARPESNRVSWIAFANQHGNNNAFNLCPHGSWYFLPWHRGYLEMYERAAASLTGNANFAMPYWDWTTLRTLPAAFTDPLYNGQPNPLYVPTRNTLTGPYALTDSLTGPGVMQSIYAETVFEAFGTSRNPAQNSTDPSWVPAGGGVQGILESTPHNNVHDNIGGYMPNPNSPLDPLFMMHHGNIDRIWLWWNTLGRQNSTDPLWLNMNFLKHYINPQGTFYSRVVKNMRSTINMGYTYDSLPTTKAKSAVTNEATAAAAAALLSIRDRNVAALLDPSQPSNLKRVKKTKPGIAKLTDPLDVPLTAPGSTLDAVIAGTDTPPNNREVFAVLRDIVMGENVNTFRVFINLMEASLDVPDSDPHFVRTVSFLRHTMAGHAGHGGALSTQVNLTATVRRLAQAGLLTGDQITVQIVPVPAPGVAASQVGTVTPGSVEIVFV
ncbi:tyrosinase family protein [Pseudomonas japonica]|uniref:tyrosinase family protein n=1 Tax=Pseudomonas japonica TaxID=256466 RepID=UPI0015E37754|nr:tyrosinase family protein [Pseudomonas japonica]MBA1290048.1 polyphenol oxidase [Pseudomonas japonica]